MAEDIEAKIRRLRELGRGATEPPTPPATSPAPPPKKPPSRSRYIGTIREKERRKRVIIGALVIVLVVLLVSAGVYSYLQKKASRELKNVKEQKLREVDSYFSKYKFTNANCTGQVNLYKSQVIAKILRAKSLDEVKAINVKVYFDKAVQAYEQCVAREKEIEYQKKLNQTKQKKLENIRLAFQPLLAMPLPDSLKAKAVSALKGLEEQVESAKTIEQVNEIDPDPYLLSLWRDYYYYRIDSITSPDLILEKKNVKMLVSKNEAKSILGSVMDYHELLQYKIKPVQYVEIALVLPRERIAGGFVKPGDRVVFFATNGTGKVYREIVNQGYVEMVLLPTSAGQISASESQSQSSSSSTTSSSAYTESHSTNYNPGETSYSNGTSYSDTYSNSQSAGQSSSASYSYNVNLAEILKAIAAGKIQASGEAKEALQSYGWKVLNLEESSNMLVMTPDTKFLIIVKVPSIFVPDILANQESLYVAKVSS